MVMPEIISITDEKDVGRAVEVAAETLRRGGVTVYPTDTLYGLGADSCNASAVEKLFRIKNRESVKPISSIVSDLDMAGRYVHGTPQAKALAEAFLPGPLTLILKRKEGIPNAAAGGADTFGIRIPDNEFCLRLAASLGGPYTATSANASGKETEPSVERILEQLGDRTTLIELVIDGGALKSRTPSTVVDASGEEVRILREGAISREDVEKAVAKR